MRRAAWEVVLMLVVVATGIFVPSSGAALAQISDHVLIKFKPSIRDNIKAGTVDQGLGELLNALDLPSGAKLWEPAIHEVLRQQQPAVRAALNLDRFLYLRVPAGISVDECLRRVERHPWVEYAEADGVGTGGVIPNDPNFSNQWHHRNAAKPSACIQTPLA